MSVGSPALADTTRGAAAWLQQADKDWADQEFERAALSAERVLAIPTATPRHKARALGIIGSAWAVMGDKPKAVAAFERMFGVDPGYSLPSSTSPRILAIYEPARTRWRVKRTARLRESLGKDLFALDLDARIPRTAKGGRPLRIPVVLTDPKHLVRGLALFYKRSSAKRYSLISLRVSDSSPALVLPGRLTASTTPYSLDLVVEAKHATGVALRRVGSPAAPVRVKVTAGQVPKATPIYRRWWFWTGVVALGVAAGFLIDYAVDVGPQPIRGRPAMSTTTRVLSVGGRFP